MSRMDADYIVVGSGIAGLTVALSLANTGNVMVITKGEVTESNSFRAQGGIAAAIGKDDSPELHQLDTLRTGGELCNEQAVRLLVHQAPQVIQQLGNWGTRFDQNGDDFALGKEGSHSVSRVLHVSGDATGKGITLALRDRVMRHPNIELITHREITDLLLDQGICVGVVSVDQHHVLESLLARKGVVLATGGCGQLFRFTTNDSNATGDGFALAYRAGAKLIDMEFIQFHPTALHIEQNPMFLISEAVRGEGAYLVNQQGEAFMQKYHQWKDLAPRDVVSRAIVQEQRSGQEIYLDARQLQVPFATRFPTIDAKCKQEGIDPSKDLIPVTPAAHFIMGGIKTDLYGETSVPRLFACGEVACTGVHGANRLASNSLLEGAVFAFQIAKKLANMEPLLIKKSAYSSPKMCIDEQEREKWKKELQQLMWDYVGIVRTNKGLQEGMEKIAKKYPADYQCENMWITAQLILEAAACRTESRGGHHRLDFPDIRPEWTKKHIVLGAMKLWKMEKKV